MISGLWPHWFRPEWLLITPLLALLIWRLWRRQKRAGRWQMLLPTHFHEVLLNGGRGSNSKLPWVALGLAWLLALFALLGPSWQRVEQISQKPVDPLVVILELTPQMLATDTPPTRLEQARRKLLDLLQKRSDAQTAIVVYAGSAHTLVPLSDDLVTSHNLLEAIRPSIMPVTGQRADLAVQKALHLLKQGALGQGRILLITSSLSEQERQGIRAALRGKSPPLLILGVGTAEGAPVTQENGSLLKDDQGAILVPRLDSTSLNDFADQVGGSYRQARGDEEDLRSLGLLASPRHMSRDGQVVQLDTWADQGHWLLLPLLLIAALAGRRGWLFCLPLMFMFPQNSQAFEFQDLWLRPDQQGQRLLEQHRPAEAAQRFEDSRWKGVALYQAQDYASAARQFAEGNSAADHYNRGNALARSGELAAALDAYEQALDRQPDFPAAQTNRALVQSLLDQANEQKPAQDEQNKADQGEEGQQASQDPNSSASPAEQNPSRSDQPGTSESLPPDNSGQATAGESTDDEQTTRPALQSADSPMTGERRQELEQWLRQIPDDPGELLRRKFRYEQQHQEKTR
ncbi:MULTISPECIES: VWA domain-containing protein [Pseudomonas]|uniref:VWA domain-containing protein n=1 Tax=Pseudomonas TaxID=286 RepID=UPI0010FA8DE2|nr:MULTISPECIES: VWA domain-containing protein [Pseudomonas]MBP1141259.1 Ca-activated chloride channel family protein [Pseudomonas sp. PvP009]MCF5732858.1 VWA domain-containing protein [Pseudomonas syringae]MCF5738714.1 VWA domain-containing protein [Pseudomonas syringae]MCF5749967.1 VWA domain-containing protein [Pseudomonas syringae]MCF5755528.1 VWA domain-containing protein [Pseudomonas syringae]